MMCEYHTIIYFFFFALLEAWFGKTNIVKSNSTLEFFFNIAVSLLRQLKKPKEG